MLTLGLTFTHKKQFHHGFSTQPVTKAVTNKMVIKRNAYTAYESPCADKNPDVKAEEVEDDVIIPETPIAKRVHVIQITPLRSTSTTTTTTNTTTLAHIVPHSCKNDRLRSSMVSMKLYAHLQRVLNNYYQTMYMRIVWNWVDQYPLNDLECLDEFLGVVPQTVETIPAAALVRQQALLAIMTQPYANVHCMIDALYTFTSFDTMFEKNIERQFTDLSQEL